MKKNKQHKTYMEQAFDSINGQDHTTHFAQVGILSKPKTKILKVEDFVDWMVEHKQVTKDFKKFFNIDLNNELEWKNAAGSLDLNKWDTTKILNWVGEHDQLSNDFEQHFKINIQDVEGIDCSSVLKIR